MSQRYNRMDERRQQSDEIKNIYASDCRSCGMCCVRYFYYPFSAAVEDSDPPHGREAQCTIYQDRPKCCSDFDPGSPACQAIREWAKMGPPAGLTELGRS